MAVLEPTKSTKISCLYIHVNNQLHKQVTCLVSVMVEHFIFSLKNNFNGDYGAVAVSKAVKTMTSLQEFE